jgi:NAD(P)H dehydrogenase (quinone)
MNVLIVHAHHEPQSFCSALSRQAAVTLQELGHAVTVSDLHALHFDPVSDRRNFTTIKNPDYLKQQMEEMYATEVGGFAPEVEAEMRKLEAADLLIFSFPLWWFGLPAILKGWVDRVYAMGRIYGGSKLYEGGIGGAKKRALVLTTTGGGAGAYGGFGFNPPISTVLAPIQHGIFWFNGFLPLEPFIAYSAARISAEEREAYLQKLGARLRGIETEPTLVLPPLADFPDFGADSKKRFMVTASQVKAPDAEYAQLVPHEKAHVADLKRQGIVLAAHIGNPDVPPWHAFLVFRESSADAVRAHVAKFPLAPYLSFEVSELLLM